MIDERLLDQPGTPSAACCSSCLSAGATPVCPQYSKQDRHQRPGSDCTPATRHGPRAFHNTIWVEIGSSNKCEHTAATSWRDAGERRRAAGAHRRYPVGAETRYPVALNLTNQWR